MAGCQLWAPNTKDGDSKPTESDREWLLAVAGGRRWAAQRRELWREVALPWQGHVSCRSSLPLGLMHLCRPCPADNDHRAEGGCGGGADAVLTIALQRGCGSAGAAPVTGAVLLPGALGLHLGEFI